MVPAVHCVVPQGNAIIMIVQTNPSLAKDHSYAWVVKIRTKKPLIFSLLYVNHLNHVEIVFLYM